MSGIDVRTMYLLLMFILGGVNGCSKNEPLGKNILYHICMQKFGTSYICVYVYINLNNTCHYIPKTGYTSLPEIRFSTENHAHSTSTPEIPIWTETQPQEMTTNKFIGK